MASNWEEFYAKTPKPADLEQNKALIKDFVDRHARENRKVVLVTSGGTTVPLEHNTVRFVDNFSAGTRGAISAEYFLDSGYAVIFMHRLKSVEPFSRHFSGQKLLEMLELADDVPTVAPPYRSKVSAILKKYKDSLEQRRLLQISFTTLSEYLWLLRGVCKCMHGLEKRALLYLAAAVSDFYIPSHEMAVHKIPSNGVPDIHLQLVPKVLAPLVSLWVPQAFVVSFKLETDESILIAKARGALENYNHHLVVANQLQNRRQQVIMVSKENNYTLRLSDEELGQGEEIEKLIVQDLVKKHANFVSS